MKSIIIAVGLMLLISGCGYDVEDICLRDKADEICIEQEHVGLANTYQVGFDLSPSMFKCVEQDRTITDLKRFTNEERRTCALLKEEQE